MKLCHYIPCHGSFLQKGLDFDICPHCWAHIFDGNDPIIDQFLKLDFENIFPQINHRISE